MIEESWKWYKCLDNFVELIRSMGIDEMKKVNDFNGLKEIGMVQVFGMINAYIKANKRNERIENNRK